MTGRRDVPQGAGAPLGRLICYGPDMTETSTAPRHNRWGLYAPFIILLALLAAWTVWWFVLARQVETRLEDQAERLRQGGWEVRYADTRVSGWPFRARVAASHITLAAPSGHAVSAPEMVAEANAYQPTKWVVVAPKGLVVDRAGKGKVAIDGDAIRMSASGLGQRWPNLALELVNPTFTAHPDGEPFPVARAARFELYARPHVVDDQATSDDVDVMVRLIDARGRPNGAVEGFAQEGQLTTEIEAVIGKASTLSGMDPAGIFAAWTAAGGTFRNVRGELKAGDSEATLSSELLRADADGRLVGSVDFQAREPGPAIAGLAGSQPGVANRVGAAGAAATAGAAQAAGRESMTLTVVFRDGRAWLGPFPIAPAPKLF